MEVRAIKFPPATLEWLRQRAFALSTADARVSLAQVVRDAVEEAKRRDEPEA